MIHGMNHFTITAENREATLAFYCGLLGLQAGFRPDLGFAGAWLYAAGAQATGAGAILHIYWDRPMPAGRTGVIDHMAFTATDLKAVKARFDAAAVKYDLRRQVGSNTWQLFSFDPNGARVELDFDPSETL
jgi:catechol 2,3-dioxygenase-like lactoylglutathione lyase family enzyme